MKTAIVSSAAIRKHGRLDAGFYLGLVDGRTAEQALIAAEQRVRRATRHLLTVTARVRTRALETRKLIESGEVVPIDVENTGQAAEDESGRD